MQHQLLLLCARRVISISSSRIIPRPGSTAPPTDGAIQKLIAFLLLSKFLDSDRTRSEFVTLGIQPARKSAFMKTHYTTRERQLYQFFLHIFTELAWLSALCGSSFCQTVTRFFLFHIQHTLQCTQAFFGLDFSVLVRFQQNKNGDVHSKPTLCYIKGLLSVNYSLR